MPTTQDILSPSAHVWAKADFGWKWEGHVAPFVAHGKQAAAAAAERMTEGDLVLIVRVTDRVKSSGQPGLIEGVLQVKPSRTADRQRQANSIKATLFAAR